MTTRLLIATLLLSATTAVASTALEQHDARVGKYARTGLDTKPKGLCMCTTAGVLKNTTGELVRTPNLALPDVRIGLVCLVPRFNSATGDRSGEDPCIEFEFVGK